MFTPYFSYGWQHIISWQAIDHILFIVALSAIYTLANWRQVLVLVTAFTLGHSITLALSVFNIVKMPISLTEFLIPCTIIATSIINLFQKNFTHKSTRLHYFLALFFGLVHGMGFASGLTSLLGKNQSPLLPLLGFNIGLEAGQIVVVSTLLVVSYLFLTRLKVNREKWIAFLSGAACSVALSILIQRHYPS